MHLVALVLSLFLAAQETPEIARSLMEEADRALAITAELTVRPEFRFIVLDVLRVLKGGRSLADSLATHPEYFSELYVNMVRAGEASGALAIIFERLSRAGARFVAADESIDTDSPGAELTLDIMAALARQQWRRYRKNWEDAKRNAVARGVHPVAWVPFGYRDGGDRKLVPDPATGHLVGEIVRMRAQGATWRELAEHLEAAGAPSPRGGGWTARAAKRIVEEGLNVRQTEALAHEEGVPERKPQKTRGAAKAKDADTVALEKRVSDALGLNVSVNHRDPGGSVQISYRNLEQLDEVMRRLARSG